MAAEGELEGPLSVQERRRAATVTCMPCSLTGLGGMLCGLAIWARLEGFSVRDETTQKSQLCGRAGILSGVAELASKWAGLVLLVKRLDAAGDLQTFKVTMQQVSG